MARSSEETGESRRSEGAMSSGHNDGATLQGEDSILVTKSFEIPRKLVWKAYIRVKANGGAAGVDGQSIEEFERELKNNLYRIWNRMSSGTYFPPPVRRVAIPKPDGGERPLGIPTVADRIAQMVVKMVLEPMVESSFHPDSYGYRPGKSAIQAVGKARERCWQYDWVLDLDIKGFFDNLDHNLVMRALRRYTECRWILLYVERWLKAPAQLADGTVVPRQSGTPQGGVISPLLANIFLHLAFDTWMQERHSHVPFERYADDILVHCRTREHAQAVLGTVKERLARCKLEIHPQKTKLVYCKDSNRCGHAENESFDFLGFTFRSRRARNRRGMYFVSFSPAISRRAAKSMRTKMRRNWRIRCRTDKSLADLANMFNPVMRGWINYYGSFHRSALYAVFRPLDRALAKWARRKYKSLKGHKRRSWQWVAGVRGRTPHLFAHWSLLRQEPRTG
jgi:group II intron reverse transcriptase/maturase